MTLALPYTTLAASPSGERMITRRFVSLAAIGGILGAAACSAPERGPAVPAADTERALPLGLSNARFFADGDPQPMVDEGLRALDREVAALRAAGKPVDRLPPVYYLAIS